MVTPMNRWFALLQVVLLAHLAACGSGEFDTGDAVRVWVNKVAPLYNPQQTYPYYSLPFCKARPQEKPEQRWLGLGQLIEGNQLIDSQMDVKFKVDKEPTPLCSVVLDTAQKKKLSNAVEQRYWLELYVEDLPVFAFVGGLSEAGDKSKPRVAQVFTHKVFELGYQGAKILTAELEQAKPVTVEEQQTISFTYEVRWKAVGGDSSRMRQHNYEKSVHPQVHWFGLVNAFLVVLILVAVVAVILLRTLRKDLARYAAADDELEALERDVSEETGWKLVHGDVFRPPPHLGLLAALVGTGAQLAGLQLLLAFFSIEGMPLMRRGSGLSIGVIGYLVTTILAGYVSGNLYTRLEGRFWVRAMLVSACLFPASVFAVVSVLNTVAIIYGSLAALPFGLIVLLLFLWAAVAFPMAALGFMLGRNSTGQAQHPCRVKRIPSPVPNSSWPFRPATLCVLGGLLPFISMFIEMFYVFRSFSDRKTVVLYEFLLLVFAMLLILSACVSIVATYVLLNAENYQWWWVSFGAAASTAGYVFAYSVYYYCAHTFMTGLFQFCFYFGYVGLACMLLGTSLGAVGFMGSYWFVNKIYASIKVD